LLKFHIQFSAIIRYRLGRPVDACCHFISRLEV
jgi:hypothetical protein